VLNVEGRQSRNESWIWRNRNPPASTSDCKVLDFFGELFISGASSISRSSASSPPNQHSSSFSRESRSTGKRILRLEQSWEARYLAATALCCDLLYLLRGGSRSESTVDLWSREWERRALDRDCSSRNDRNRRPRIRCHLDRVAYCSWCTRRNTRCPGRTAPYCNTWENNVHDEYCRGVFSAIAEKSNVPHVRPPQTVRSCKRPRIESNSGSMECFSGTSI